MMNGYGLVATRLATGLGLVCAVATAACSSQSTTSGGQGGTGGAGGGFGVGGYAPVSCSTPAGTIEALPNVADAAAVLQGDWRICPPSFGGVPADAVGLRFAAASTVPGNVDPTVGGLADALVQGATGPEPGRGFAYQLTYDVVQSPGLSGSSMQLYIHASTGGFGGTFVFSPSPRELSVDLGEDQAPVLFVPM